MAQAGRGVTNPSVRVVVERRELDKKGTDAFGIGAAIVRSGRKRYAGVPLTFTIRITVSLPVYYLVPQCCYCIL
jgi:hypothetical protein